MSNLKPQYVFVDLETTGLDAYEDVPLEIAFVLTDEWGTEIDAVDMLIHDGTAAFKDQIHKGKQHKIVGPMHEKSGLWKDLDNREMLPNWGGVYEVEEELIKWLQANDVPKGEIPMAGNSIGSLDRPFLIAHFPKLNQYLSYRNVDMSSFKEVCRKTNPVLYQNIEPIIGHKADASHRALDDARASVREYQTYLDEFLITGEN
jgi:oligoribonuclease (3'-5' exoribonuclease)